MTKGQLSPEESEALLNKSEYAMFLGRQCERGEEELLAEKQKYEQLQKPLSEDARKRADQLEFVRSQISSIDYALKFHKRRRLAQIKPTDEHLKLLKSMEFLGLWLGDTVSIGADGKRPFGNSNVIGDVARLLEWTLPNDDLSHEQQEEAERLLDELPYALNAFIESLPLQ